MAIPEHSRRTNGCNDEAPDPATHQPTPKVVQLQFLSYRCIIM
jgi:hypothetical protein